MQTPNEQITSWIDDAVQDILSFISSSESIQVELTIAGLCVMFSFIVYIVTKVANDIDSNEYIVFEHEENDEQEIKG